MSQTATHRVDPGQIGLKADPEVQQGYHVAGAVDVHAPAVAAHDLDARV